MVDGIEKTSEVCGDLRGLMIARIGGREADNSSPLQGQADWQAGVHCLHVSSRWARR
jgi:hypothetical protein